MSAARPGEPGTTEVGATLSRMVAAGDLDAPLPGHGRTPERHRMLFELARRRPVAVARCAEAHLDAVAILAEAGRSAPPSTVYGVWASSGDLHLDRDGGVVDGTKPFCSGLGIVGRALVTASDADGGVVLLDLDVTGGDTVGLDTTPWRTSALAATGTGTVTFRRHTVERTDEVGATGWYLDRPGFWHGACGPAACWAGSACGLVDVAEALVDDDPHRRAHLGGLRAAAWQMAAVLDRAGREIDERPHDGAAARYRALAVRHTVERACSDVLDRFGRAFGPRPFVGDVDADRRFADTHLYLRQDHAERDLHQLGTLDGFDPTGTG